MSDIPISNTSYPSSPRQLLVIKFTCIVISTILIGYLIIKALYIIFPQNSKDDYAFYFAIYVGITSFFISMTLPTIPMMILSIKNGLLNVLAWLIICISGIMISQASFTFTLKFAPYWITCIFLSPTCILCSIYCYQTLKRIWKQIHEPKDELAVQV